MPLLKAIRTLAAKVETTIGTAISLSASDGVFNAYDLEIQPSIEFNKRQAQGSFDNLKAVAGARKGTATFKTDIEWDGTSTLPPWATVLLPACGYVESSQVFTPRSEGPGSNVKTLTIGAYIDGKFKSIAGAVGSFKLVCPSGEQCMIEWEFDGVWQAETDVALISPTYPTADPIRFASAVCTYGGTGLKVENVTVDAGNQKIMRQDPTTDAGYISGLVVNRTPMIEANPEATLVATDDMYGDLIGMTEAAFALTLDGPAPVASTSTIAISAPKAQIVSSTEGERDGMVIDEIQWDCNKNGANKDQDVSITFAESV